MHSPFPEDYQNIQLSQFSGNGPRNWGKWITLGAGYYTYAVDISTGFSNNIMIAENYTSQASMLNTIGGSFPYNRSAEGSRLLAFNKDKDLIWSYPNGIPPASHTQQEIIISDINNSGNGYCLVTGTKLYDTSQRHKCLIAQFSDKGTPDWIFELEGPDCSYGNSICSDADGNIYLSGYYSGSVNLRTKANNNISITSKGPQDIFLLKLDPNLNVEWVKTWYGQFGLKGPLLALDSAANIYAVFSASSIAESADSPMEPTKSITERDLSIYAFNQQGQEIRNRGHYLQFPAECCAIAIDSEDTLFIAGYELTNGLRGEERAAFLTWKNANSNIWNTMDWETSDNLSELNDLKVDELGNLYLCGTFKGVISYSLDGQDSATRSRNETRDVFIMKFKPK
jgi:hypothetical protein